MHLFAKKYSVFLTTYIPLTFRINCQLVTNKPRNHRSATFFHQLVFLFGNNGNMHSFFRSVSLHIGAPCEARWFRSCKYSSAYSRNSTDFYPMYLVAGRSGCSLCYDEPIKFWTRQGIVRKHAFSTAVEGLFRDCHVRPCQNTIRRTRNNQLQFHIGRFLTIVRFSPQPLRVLHDNLLGSSLWDAELSFGCFLTTSLQLSTHHRSFGRPMKYSQCANFSEFHPPREFPRVQFSMHISERMNANNNPIVFKLFW